MLTLLLTEGLRRIIMRLSSSYMLSEKEKTAVKVARRVAQSCSRRFIHAVIPALTLADAPTGDDAEVVKYLESNVEAHLDQSPLRIRALNYRFPLGWYAKPIYEDPRFLERSQALIDQADVIGSERVVGGTKTSDFPDCVAVGDNNDFTCTGTLVHQKLVLTAGHCLDRPPNRIFIGASLFAPGLMVQVQKCVRHPQYHQDQTHHNDVALLVLSSAVTTVTLRAIGTKPEIQAADFTRIVGFGTSNPDGDFGLGVKRMADVPIVSNSGAGTTDKDTFGCDPGFEFVASSPLKRDSCPGDSGGPAYILRGAEFVLAGVTSRGVKNSANVCGDGGIYARADQYQTFIQQVIQQEHI